jgi:L-2,4-diaminobutyrate decarboxylase
MQMPGLITAVLFKRGRDSYQAFSQQASYLFEKDPQEEWFNLAHRTLECTKRMLSLKLYVALKLYGKGVFSNFIDQTYGLARHFGTMLETAPDFELALSPQSNIVCFRHTPKGWAGDLDDLQAFLRKSLLEEARFYVVQTRLPKGLHLRTTLMNPLTQPEDLAALLTEIRRLGAQYLGQKR